MASSKTTGFVPKFCVSGAAFVLATPRSGQKNKKLFHFVEPISRRGVRIKRGKMQGCMNAIAIRDGRLFEMTLKATVIYDNFDFATRAAALLERVAIRVREAMKWDVKPWRLDVLKQSSLAEAAVAEAADADLIVFALSKAHSPPPELTAWLEHWEAHRQIEDTAVMVLSPDERDAATPLWHELKQFAGRHGLAFLSSRDVRDNGDSMRFVHQLWQRRQPVVPGPELIAGLPHPPRPPRHRGINE